MSSDFSFKAMNAVHRVLLKVTFGHYGWNVMKMPVVELTTKGRKTGLPRTVMLTSPLQEGDTYVVVASRGGDDTHPAWFLNLRDNPDVEVTIGGKAKQAMRAQVADTETRARLWPKVTADFKNYAGYQTKTDREIPLVLLAPV